MHDYESHLKLIIHPSSRGTGFIRSLKGQPHFLVLVIVSTKPFLYTLYFTLLSQPIKTNEVLPLFPVDVSDLTITATKPISYTTIQAHGNASLRYKTPTQKDIACLVLLGHSFTYFNQIENHINT